MRQVTEPGNTTRLQNAEKLMLKGLESLDGDCLAVLSTADGRLCAATETNRQKASRKAALSSALLSLSQRFCEEALDSANGEIVLSAMNGHSVIVRLSLGSTSYQLCLVSSNADNLATILRVTRDLSNKISQLPAE